MSRPSPKARSRRRKQRARKIALLVGTMAVLCGLVYVLDDLVGLDLRWRLYQVRIAVLGNPIKD